MKTIAALAFIIIAYGIVGTLDYQDAVAAAQTATTWSA